MVLAPKLVILSSLLLNVVWPAAAAQLPASANTGAADLSSSSDVFDRLLGLLRAIPARWETLPAPLVPPSGRSIEEVLHSASKAQADEASDWITRLKSTSPGDRPALIRSQLHRRIPTEVDLWQPAVVAQSQEGTNIEEAALIVEAWLQWAEGVGRKDVLKLAASFGMDIFKIRLGAPAVLPVISTWVALPFASSADRSQATLLCDLADILFRLGENQKALESYRDARQLFVAIGSQVGQGLSWKGESEVLLLLGDNEKALDAVRNARHLFVAAGAQLLQAEIWDDEADVLFRLDRNRQALEAYRNARQLHIVVGDQLGQGNAWLGEAEVLLRLGEDLMALEAYRNSRKMFIAVGDRLGQGNTWKGEADVMFRLERQQEALAAARNARQLLVAVGDELGQGNTWMREGEVLFVQGEYQGSLQAYRSARDLFVSRGDPLGQGNSWLGEAQNLRRMHLWTEAIKAAQAAIALYLATGVVQGQINSLIVKAQAEAGAGDLPSADRSAREAIQLHSQWRKTSITEVQRTDQEDTISAAYDILVPLRTGQPGQEAEALRLAEEARSRVLLDFLTSGASGRDRVVGGDLMTERRRLEAESWAIEDELRRSVEPEREKDLRLRRFQLDQDLEWNRHQEILAQQESLAAAPPLDATAIQGLAQKTGPLLLFYSTESKTLGFLVLPPPAPITIRSIDLSREALGQQSRTLTRDLANPLYEQRAWETARKLWDLLIAPFSDRIPAGGPLVIVPHGPLHELPFEALLAPDGSPLFERWRTSVTPSASALEFARNRHAAVSSSNSFLAFASGQGLAGPLAEAFEIAAFFGTDKAAFRPTEALFPSYEKFATQARNLFIATRGVHTEGNRSETYLEIQPTPGIHDSRLTAAEIATIPLQAELVTLAACDTSHGRALLSDERLDLTRSFIMAGAVAVLATRWKVPEDPRTSRFLIDFFQAYRQGDSQGHGLRKDEALTEARRRSRERGDPAQVWAAWVLVGDAR